MQSVLTYLDAAVKVAPRWLDPYLPLAQKVLEAGASGSVAAALNAVNDTASGALRFVEQSQLPANVPYELYIGQTACIPTRDNLHDLFNGLVWLKYPQTKRRLNVLHSQQIALNGVTHSRGSLRDALTLFDENAAILQAPDALIDALRARDWQTLFVERRADWNSARLVLFGHALLEKLIQPRKAITAHVWVVEELTDDALASSLNAERLSAKDFLPLPVLGVPGWWPANEEPGFYDDPKVFRASRKS